MYKHFDATPILSQYVDSLWWSSNTHGVAEKMIIVPDGFSKILIIFKDKKIIQYFLTGIWTKPQEFIVPAETEAIGCRLKILAPEHVLRRSMAHLVDGQEKLPLEFLNARHLDFGNTEKVVRDLEKELLNLMVKKEAVGKKVRLSQLLYQTEGNLSVREVAEQTYWTSQQINRYLKKYLGINLKTFLRIQRAYSAYFKIREGNFTPAENYYDQSHYIREIKEHSGASPKQIYKDLDQKFKHIKFSEK